MGLSIKVKKSLKLKAAHVPVSPDDEPPSVVEMIEQVQTRLAKEEVGERENYFRPSMFFGCDRANVFHYAHSPEGLNLIDNRLRRTLANGDVVHSVVQGWLAESYDIFFSKEVPVRLTISGALVKGHCDGLFIFRRDNYRWGLEIKSMIHDEFMKWQTKPRPDHVQQACTYGKFMGLKWMTMLYWDKDKSFLKEHHVRVTNEFWAETKERVRHLKVYADKFMADPKAKNLPKFDESTCDRFFCRYARYCKRMGAPLP